MKTFKIIDASISLALIIVLLFWYYNNPSIERMIESYFLAGGWQCISMIIHATNKWFTKKWNSRHIYHWISFISVITLPLGSYWILALTAPFMAIFYTGLCYYEVILITSVQATSENSSQPQN
jgi:hypothetical protein